MAKVRQIDVEGTPPSYQLLVEREDGTWFVMQDTEQVLRTYRPKRDESVRLYRVWK